MVLTVAARPAAVTVDSRLGGLPPNWYASVMGTGIVANAIPALGVHSGPLFLAAALVWLLASAWLVTLTVAVIRHGRSWLANPVVSQFYGAPPMAMLTDTWAIDAALNVRPEPSRAASSRARAGRSARCVLEVLACGGTCPQSSAHHSPARCKNRYPLITKMPARNTGPLRR